MKHVHYDCIVAWAEGKQIQYLDDQHGVWVDAPVPTWYHNTAYRVKPDPVVLQYRVALHKNLGEYYIIMWTNENYLKPDGTPPGSTFIRWLTDIQTVTIEDN